MAARLVEQHPAAAGTDHHRHLTGGSRSGSQFGERPLGRRLGEFLDVVPVEQLETDRVPDALAAGLHAGVAHCNGAHTEHGAHLVVSGEQPIGVRDQDPATTVAVAGRHLRNVATGRTGGCVGPLEQFDLGGLGDLVGSDLCRARVLHRLPGQCHRAGAATSLTRRGRGRFRGGEQPPFGEVGGVGEPGGFANHDTNPGTPIAARGEFLDATVVEVRRRRCFVLGEDLGEVSAGA